MVGLERQDMCLPIADSELFYSSTDLVASDPFDQCLDMEFNRDTWIRKNTYEHCRAGIFIHMLLLIATIDI